MCGLTTTVYMFNRAAMRIHEGQVSAWMAVVTTTHTHTTLNTESTAGVFIM